ncbi:MAG TPA: glycoside hydrolase family 44 protein [Anaerolineales bacterium]
MPKLLRFPTPSLVLFGLLALFSAGPALQNGLAVAPLGALPGSLPAAATGPGLSVDAAAGRHPISPDIYGMNFADEDLAKELRLPVRRWGGNATTRYNWQNDSTNHASDWYFEDIPNDNPNPGALPDGSSSDQFIDQNRRTGTNTLLTLPLIGWAAKGTPQNRSNACGFSVALYGPQQSVDPWQPDCGNGVDLNGNPITRNNPADTSIAITPAFVQDWLRYLAARYGPASGGGVRFYDLDNEPMLWSSTHRDVHPNPTSYDELRDRTFNYAAAVKAVDPAAQTLGPVLWGWTAYWYSALDQAAGGSWWDTRPDRKAHQDLPFVVWYLQQMQAYQQAHAGLRIVDYLDLHYYPQANGVSLSPAGDANTQALRLRSTRSLWDPSYADESWIFDTEGGPAVRLIPRMREWVNQNYPGTKLAISEYNWGALDSLNGALAQADVLGIFGREGLDLAALWDPPASAQPGAFAFRMYLNYDGFGHTFGDQSVQAASANQDQLAIYAARRSRDGALTLMIINKSGADLDSPVTVSGFAATQAGAVSAQVYRYSAADLSAIRQAPSQTVSGAGFSARFPANSITLVVIPGAPFTFKNPRFLPFMIK